MILELSTSLLAGGIFGMSHYFKNGGGNDDHKKIQLIARNCGLVSRDGKEIRIYRKDRKNKKFSEYVYQMPQGMSSKQFQDKLDHFQDGLNIKKSTLDISLSDLKDLKLRKDIFKQIEKLLEKKRDLRKEVEISYDGMLKIRVYNEPLTSNYTFEEATNKKINGWKTVIGVDRTGKRILIDWDKVYNLICAGTPGYGKSNWINSTINTLILNHPDDVTFTLIDLKSGLEFNKYRNLKQVTSYASTPVEAKESLKEAIKKMDEVNAYLLENGYSNVKEAGLKGRHFVILDEAADIADDKECQGYLKDIARKARASGLKLIYATQYPTVETVSSQVKRNCLGRLTFVLDTSVASNVVLDQGGAEQLPVIEGRALYKEGLKPIQVQTPLITNETVKKIIEPHITFKARKETPKNEQRDIKTAATRGNMLIVEETRLS
jgi:DNA segregation ATPase FtsK/SpoIIIE, S-DNA-T family